MATCTGCGDGCGYGACKGTCQGCTGGCDDGCSGCGGFCAHRCDGCDGSCEGDCEGTCNGGCTSSCKTFCNTACSASNAAEVIANLGSTVYQNGRWQANDVANIQKAITNELQRRGRFSFEKPPPTPVSGGRLLAAQYKKILEDVYDMDSTKDWRGNVFVGKKVYASDLRPAIDYIKQLMNTVVAKP